MPTTNEQLIMNHILRTRLIHQNLLNHMVSQDEVLFDLARQGQRQGQGTAQRRRVVEPINHSRPRNRAGTYFETRGASDNPMAWMANLFDNSGNFATNNTTDWHRFGNWNILGAAPSQFGDQRRQANIWNTFNPFTDLPNLFGAFQQTSDSINRGLTDQEMRDSLWIGNYDGINNPINTMCPITTYEFQPDTEIAMINHCRHIFCSAALRRWLATHSTCPVCRYDIHSRDTTTAINNNTHRNSDNMLHTDADADEPQTDMADDNTDNNMSTSYTIQWHVEPINMNGDASGNTIHRSTIRTTNLDQGLEQFLREYIGITSNNGSMNGSANANGTGDRNDNSEQNVTVMDNNNQDEMFTRLLTETLSSISNGIRTLDRSNSNSIYDVSGNHMEHPGLM